VIATTSSRGSTKAAAINATAAHKRTPPIPEYTNVYTAVSTRTPMEIIWVVSLNFIL
jgi:hypothetical protein